MNATARDGKRNDSRASRLIELFHEVDTILAAANAAGGKRPCIKTILDAKRIFDPMVPARSSYYRLRQLWEKSGHDVASLDDGRYLSEGGRRAAFDEAAFKFFARQYLRGGRPGIATCYAKLQEAAKAQGWHIPSQATVMRVLRRRIPSEVQAARRGAVADGQGDKMKAVAITHEPITLNLPGLRVIVQPLPREGDSNGVKMGVEITVSLKMEDDSTAD